MPDKNGLDPLIDTRDGAHLQLVDVSQTFGARSVINQLSLEIAPSEFVTVVGQSGCGKTTLLRLLAGLDRPSQGQIYLDRQPLTGLHPTMRLMFQEARLLPWRSVLENVTLGQQRQSRSRGLEALQQVGLADRAKDWPTFLSGGQRQRVALARALMNHPRLLLLDEPLGALDALTRLEMQQLICSLWQTQKFTAVLVTHDVEEAVYLGTRVLALDHGGIPLNLPVPLPYPRDRSSTAFAILKSQLLNQILNGVCI